MKIDSKSWVAFIDILGTSDSVTSDSHSKFVTSLSNFINEVSVTGAAYRIHGIPFFNLSEEDWEEDNREHGREFAEQTHVFSDSVVFISPVKYTYATYNDSRGYAPSFSSLEREFINPVVEIIQSAWSHNLIVRGAISCGQINADKSTSLLTGDGLVRAAKLEATQEWAWIAVSPECDDLLEGFDFKDEFIRTNVPLKTGVKEMYTLNPKLLGPKRLADTLYSSWKNFEEPNSAQKKCKNTLVWLDENKVGPARLTKDDSSLLGILFQEHRYRISINMKESKEAQSATAYEVCKEQLTQIDCCTDILRSEIVENNSEISFTFTYKGSPHRAPDILGILSERLQDRIEFDELAFYDGAEKIQARTSLNFSAAMIANFDKLCGMTSSRPAENIVSQFHQCAVEKDYATAKSLMNELFSRLPEEIPTTGIEYDTSINIPLMHSYPLPFENNQFNWWCDGELWYNYAMVCANMENHSDSLKYALLAVALRPSNSDAWDQVGHSLSYSGHEEDSLEWFKEAIKIRPDHYKHHFHLGQTLSAIQRFEEAAPHLLEALNLNNSHWQSWAILSMCQVNEGDYDSTIQSADKAKKNGAPWIAYTLWKSLALCSQNKYLESLKTLEDGLQSANLYKELLTSIYLHCMIELDAVSEIPNQNILEWLGNDDFQLSILASQALILSNQAAYFIDTPPTATPKTDSERITYSLVRELAARENSAHDRPIEDNPDISSSPNSLSLCPRTLCRCAQYKILYSHYDNEG